MPWSKLSSGSYLDSIPVGLSLRSTHTLILLLFVILSCLFTEILGANLLLRLYTFALLLRKTLSATLYDKLLKLLVSEVAQ